jgi:hypothetical protein
MGRKIIQSLTDPKIRSIQIIQRTIATSTLTSVPLAMPRVLFGANICNSSRHATQLTGPVFNPGSAAKHWGLEPKIPDGSLHAL